METNIYDLIIIGGGPAGLTAGIYAARSGLNTVLLERAALGGQIISTDWIENYPGFAEGLSGPDLVDGMTAQARRFDLKILAEAVESVDLSGEIKIVNLATDTLAARTIIIASGASPRKLGIPGEDRFYGRGVSFCATCDGPFYKDKIIAAVGGGDTAVQESIYLTRFVKKVYLIHRRDQLRAAKILQKRAIANDKIEFIWNSVVTDINGGLTNVDSITVKNVKTEKMRDLVVAGCFIWVGIQPNTDYLKNSIKLDENGFIITNSAMGTSVPGVFAAGDVRNTHLRQVATAVGDAAVAAVSAERFLENK